MDKIVAVFLTIIAGSLYYIMMSLSIPKDVNCSFSANIWTDILAILFGLLLINHNGDNNNNFLINLLGVAIITEHVWQFMINKTSS